MEFIKPGTYIDFMKYRGPVITVLGLMATLSLVSLFYPGPNYGIDFAGGTEVQLQFLGDTTPAEVREALALRDLHRRGRGGSGRLEADGGEDHLPVRLVPGDLHGLVDFVVLQKSVEGNVDLGPIPMCIPRELLDVLKAVAGDHFHCNIPPVSMFIDLINPEMIKNINRVHLV